MFAAVHINFVEHKTSYLSRSLADRWGTTVDFTTSFLHSSRFSAFRSMMLHLRPVHSLMLSSHRFLCLPLRLPPWTVPCRIVLASPDDRVTCPYHFSLRLFTVVKRSSYGPMAFPILAFTSSLVMWSQHKTNYFKTLSCKTAVVLDWMCRHSRRLSSFSALWSFFLQKKTKQHKTPTEQQNANRKDRALSSVPLWRNRPNRNTTTLPVIWLPSSKAADMAHLCVLQNQALGVCRSAEALFLTCGTHRREDLVDTTISSNSEEDEEKDLHALPHQIIFYWLLYQTFILFSETQKCVTQEQFLVRVWLWNGLE